MAEIQTETLPEFFNRTPFDMVRDIEYDEPGGTIAHGRFHTLTGGSGHNQMTPADADLFATLTRLCVVKGNDYGILHSCTLNSLGHRFFHMVGRLQRNFALYCFGTGQGWGKDQVLDQLALAQTLLTGSGVDVPPTMTVAAFLT